MNKKGHYRRIPIIITDILDDGGMEFQGKNWFYNILVDLNIWWDFFVLELEELPIYVEIDENE